ncbi:hypothetical protein ACYPKM_00570 [Pseudomonas aeruginosa]
MTTQWIEDFKNAHFELFGTEATVEEFSEGRWTWQANGKSDQYLYHREGIEKMTATFKHRIRRQYEIMPILPCMMQIPQQHWRKSTDGHSEHAFFAGHEMTLNKLCGSEGGYALSYLGMSAKSFKTPADAKAESARFADKVLHDLHLSLQPGVTSD